MKKGGKAEMGGVASLVSVPIFLKSAIAVIS